MTTDTQSVLELCEQLSAARRAEVVDFARFLLHQESSGRDEPDVDEAWEELIGETKSRPKLDAFVKAALAEGSEPMDPQQL